MSNLESDSGEGPSTVTATDVTGEVELPPKQIEPTNSLIQALDLSGVVQTLGADMAFPAHGEDRCWILASGTIDLFYIDQYLCTNVPNLTSMNRASSKIQQLLRLQQILQSFQLDPQFVH